MVCVSLFGDNPAEECLVGGRSVKTPDHAKSRLTSPEITYKYIPYVGEQAEFQNYDAIDLSLHRISRHEQALRLDDPCENNPAGHFFSSERFGEGQKEKKATITRIGRSLPACNPSCIPLRISWIFVCIY